MKQNLPQFYELTAYQHAPHHGLTAPEVDQTVIPAAVIDSSDYPSREDWVMAFAIDYNQEFDINTHMSIRVLRPKEVSNHIRSLKRQHRHQAVQSFLNNIAESMLINLRSDLLPSFYSMPPGMYQIPTTGKIEEKISGR